MSEDEAKKEKQKEKKPIRILRDRRGGVPKDVVGRNQERIGVRKWIIEALEEGPLTSVEIANKTGGIIHIHEVVWHIMGMKKYGQIIEGEERDGYYEYALLKEEKE